MFIGYYCKYKVKLTLPEIGIGTADCAEREVEVVDEVGTELKFWLGNLMLLALGEKT